MKSGSIPQKEWRAFGALSSTVNDIDQKCMYILEKVKEAFARSSVLASGVCDFSLTPEKGSTKVATLTSPFGEGRFVKSWSRTTDSLQAVLVFERAIRDKYDRIYWEPIWSIQVPRFDVATSGSGDSAIEFDPNGFGDDDKNAGFSVAIAIVAGLVDGPAEPHG